nr:hypothetical protein [Tanacetum cinerariifolium]
MSVIEFVINECRLGYIIVDFNSLFCYKQMEPRRTTRSTVDQEIVNTTTVTNAQLQAMIDQGVTAALAAHDALRSTNGDDSHNSRTDDGGQILSSKQDQETGNRTLGFEGQKSGCHEGGVQGHFKRECPKLKNNNNHSNHGGRNNAPARVYAVGHAGTDPYTNVVTVIGVLRKLFAFLEETKP